MGGKLAEIQISDKVKFMTCLGICLLEILAVNGHSLVSLLDVVEHALQVVGECVAVRSLRGKKDGAPIRISIFSITAIETKIPVDMVSSWKKRRKLRETSTASNWNNATKRRRRKKTKRAL